MPADNRPLLTTPTLMTWVEPQHFRKDKSLGKSWFQQMGQSIALKVIGGQLQLVLRCLNSSEGELPNGTVLLNIVFIVLLYIFAL